MSPGALVVTSVNPASGVDLQLRRLAAWTALGFEALTANTQAEAKALRAAGLPAERILTVEPTETGLERFGKPAPRVAPLIARVRRERPGRPVLLTNADIHPAARNGGFVDFWLSAGPALALTREEVDMVESASFGERDPYRGGLDAFLLSPEALAQVDDALGEIAVAERMCFGVPGWDFLLGALVLSDRIGGRIADGGLLLHEVHRPTYANVEEFGAYIADMRALGAVESGSAVEAAQEMSDRIAAECEATAPLAELTRSLWFARVEPPRPPSARAQTVALRLRALCPWIRWSYDFTAMAALADREASGGGSTEGFSRAATFFVRSPSLDHRFAETLAAILFELERRRDAPRPVSTDYPPNSLHAQAVEDIARTTTAQPALRRLELARLLAEEWLHYGVLNTRLFDMVALLCENDDERRLVAEIAAFMPRPERRDVA